MRKKIIFDPNPFCYGATSALLSITKHLGDFEKVLLATDCSQELADSSFDQIIPCNVKSSNAVAEALRQLQPIDGYVSVSNNTNIALVKEQQIPLVYVDILFWMVGNAHLGMEYASHYIIEDFPAVSERVAHFQQLLKNYSIVPPLLDISSIPKIETTEKTLLVNFGGAESPYLKPGVNTQYPAMMVELLIAALGHSPFQKIIIATGQKAVRSIKARVTQMPQHIKVCTLSHVEFLQQLKHAHAFFTAPGLNAPFEGFYYGVPTFFLPPQNFTQVFQLKIYQEHGILPTFRLNLDDLYTGYSFDVFGDEQQQTAIILSLLEQLDNDEQRKQYLIGIFREYLRLLSTPTQFINHLQKQQQTFINTLGYNGGKMAAELIQKVYA